MISGRWVVALCCVLFTAPHKGIAEPTARIHGGAMAEADTVAAAKKPPRSPSGAFYRSLALSGWGQYYNGRHLKAFLAFGCEAAFLSGTILKTRELRRSRGDPVYESMRTNRNTFIYAVLITRLISTFDAYVDAHLEDFDVSDDLTLIRTSGGGLRLAVMLNRGMNERQRGSSLFAAIHFYLNDDSCQQ